MRPPSSLCRLFPGSRSRDRDRDRDRDMERAPSSLSLSSLPRRRPRRRAGSLLLRLVLSFFLFLWLLLDIVVCVLCCDYTQQRSRRHQQNAALPYFGCVLALDGADLKTAASRQQVHCQAVLRGRQKVATVPTAAFFLGWPCLEWSSGYS